MSERLLLCTDLDRTLLPNGPQPESPQARKLFARLMARPEFILVFATGRHQALVEDAIRLYQLPHPDYVISDVGSKIYTVHNSKWQAMQEWEDEIAPDWRGLSREQLHQLLRDHPLLHLQEASKQNTHKLSYYVPLHADHEALIRELEQRLARQGVRANLIWSVDEPAGLGLLDVLPLSASKLHALHFLRQYLDLAEDAILFAGDSGNDLPVLTSGIPAVLVANASPEVRKAALTGSAHGQNTNRLYLAQGGLLDMNGNYSAGILEGLQHFHPALAPLLQELLEGNAP